MNIPNEPVSTILFGREFQLLTTQFAKKITLVGLYNTLCFNIHNTDTGTDITLF